MHVRFLRGAKDELTKARDYYEDNQEGLGSELYGEIERAISEILVRPSRWPQVSGNIRRFVIQRFPYVILYEERENELLIVSIMHTSRRPGYWRSRVTKK